MALLAEELVEEWLNRQGYFTLRGAKLGVHEIDILAVRFTSLGIERRHIEVQASVNPVSYITKWTKQDQRETGRTVNSSAKRTEEQWQRSVDEWVKKKFDLSRKCKLRESLCQGNWTRELVINRVYDEDEPKRLEQCGIRILRLHDILDELITGRSAIERAAGGDLADLVALRDMIRT